MRLIVVPSPPPPAPIPVQPVYNQINLPVVNTDGSLKNPYTYVTLPPIIPPTPVLKDPIYDYYAAYYGDMNPHDVYGFVNYHRYVSNSEISNHVWAFREIVDWVESFATDYVLAQRSTDGGHWRLVFVAPPDLSKFETWFKAQRVITFFVRTVHETEVREWLATNARRSFRVSQVNGMTYVVLRDQNDALAFKLRWDGIDEIDQTK